MNYTFEEIQLLRISAQRAQKKGFISASEYDDIINYLNGLEEQMKKRSQYNIDISKKYLQFQRYAQ